MSNDGRELVEFVTKSQLRSDDSVDLSQGCGRLQTFESLSSNFLMFKLSSSPPSSAFSNIFNNILFPF